MEETVEHQLMIRIPVTQRLELSVDILCITLQLLVEISIQGDIASQLRKEQQFDIFIKLKNNACPLLDSL